jgi:hypothetical protein
MIDALDRTLETLLRQELPPHILEQVAITFARPGEDFPPQSVSLPTIDLFLFDVRENRDLRTSEWLVEGNVGTLTRERPPVRLDCSYLVTAWPSPHVLQPEPSIQEHHLLGAVILALLRYPVLPAAVLEPELQHAGVEHPTTILHQGPLKGMADFWQALGGKPRAAFTYTVTVALQPFEPAPAGPPVTEKVFEIGEWRERPGAGP